MSSTNDYVELLRQAALQRAVDDLLKEKIGSSTSRVERDSYATKIKCLAAVGVVITRSALYMRVQRLSKKLKEKHPPANEIITRASGSEVSSLDSPTVNTTDIVDDAVESSEGLSARKAGRPEGTTDQNKRDKVKNRKECINSITHDYSTELSRCQILKKKCENYFLQRLIEDKKAEFGVTCEIKAHTIRARVRRNNLDPEGRGVTSPVKEAERALVVLCLQMSRICQPLTVPEATILFNDLIDNTPTQQALKEFHAARGIDSGDSSSVGLGWWYGFKKRYVEVLETKRGENFASIRADWTKKSNINQMYVVIYAEMVDARIASVRSCPVFTDRNGNTVDECKRFGLVQEIKIDHKDYMLFADESGCKTNQKADGRVGNTKYIVERGTLPQTICCTNDHRFTVLPFTSASGHAVCCVVIFQHANKELPILWKSGVDILVEPARNANGEIEYGLNIGEGKYHPGGPTCRYRGKDVKCLTFASESGGITGEILVQILSYFDSIELFPRLPGGPIPMLVIDGHQSRLDPMFIHYINNPQHKWKVCFGVPYATVLWQVGDASEQNGKFKTEWYKVKDVMMKWKIHHLLPCSLGPTDIIPLVSRIFHDSYGRVNSNLKAVADRGWSPANRKLLEHPSLLDDSKETTKVSPSPPCEAENKVDSESMVTLNINSGAAGNVLDRIITARARSAGARKAAEERKRKGTLVVENLKAAKKLSTGVLASNGIHCLNDPRFLDVYNEKRETAREKREMREAGKKEMLLRKISGVKALREKHGHESIHLFSLCNKDECGIYLQYKKQSAKDPGMPKDLADRRARCVEWMRRPSPTASPESTDDDDEGGMEVFAREEDVADGVDGLLGLAANELDGFFASATGDDAAQEESLLEMEGI